ncbi:polymorphic toxin-type HINT domain-containing protein [Luedemannella flava]
MHTTDNHPFWNYRARTWTEAGQLHPGDQLMTDQLKPVVVTEVREVLRAEAMYNLTVDKVHTYYVIAGQTSVLVHNSNCPTGARFVADAKGEVNDLFGPQGSEAINKLAGDGYRNDVAAYLREHGLMVVTDLENRVAMTFATPYGDRVFDMGVWDRDGKLIAYVETKWGAKKYGGVQKMKDDWLRDNFGYPIHIQQSHY